VRAQNFLREKSVVCSSSHNGFGTISTDLTLIPMSDGRPRVTRIIMSFYELSIDASNSRKFRKMTLFRAKL